MTPQQIAAALNAAADSAEAGDLEEYEALLEMYEDTLTNIEEGEIVKARVLRVTDKVVILDLGFKSEGVISKSEFNNVTDLKVGDEVEVFLETAVNHHVRVQLVQVQQEREHSVAQAMRSRAQALVHHVAAIERRRLHAGTCTGSGCGCRWMRPDSSGTFQGRRTCPSASATARNQVRSARRAYAVDTPVVGWRGKRVNTLRLWTVSVRVFSLCLNPLVRSPCSAGAPSSRGLNAGRRSPSSREALPRFRAARTAAPPDAAARQRRCSRACRRS